ncbi:hypothetical protein TK11N_07440 [Tetragenococcus koreensis]|uniref:Uncharacterized protein n=1 Tax=Tetragenococcus koreensis TaxID=290335 RepID=A0AAN4RLJ4_9ENTE|nr:hypothetical protein TK11N_07440 [Tetragenococcus koreensis]GEQ51321.1 hypothetical protein TK12N_06650 [Tetragenococcus koreensis]GEQ53970.1 hypothetical protein TK2N_08140 [Tetragenococcus koreensis]GEQ56286.1 hypothetical protein TK4N_06290 [Tetragenococcus koreensis]GEQ58868.1 hypothetical protein TK6N_07070 [Tetragenococcus koreensis]
MRKLGKEEEIIKYIEFMNSICSVYDPIKNSPILNNHKNLSFVTKKIEDRI